MVRKKYTPKQGDIVSVDFNPQKGYKQKGCSSALVVSGGIFNEKTGFVLVCLITTKNNKFPLPILLPEDIATDNFLGSILNILESFYRK